MAGYPIRVRVVLSVIVFPLLSSGTAPQATHGRQSPTFSVGCGTTLPLLLLLMKGASAVRRLLVRIGKVGHLVNGSKTGRRRL